MSVSYTCPNPECKATLKTPNPVPPGKRVKCPKCNQPFVPEPEPAAPAAGPGTFKLADEPKKPADAPKPSPAAKKPVDDDDEDPESVRRGYGVTKETEEEIAEAEKNKPKFTEIQDKFKKSARGPAMSLLVMPTNIMVGVGLIITIAGLVWFVVGMWPLVFNDAPPGDEEVEDAIVNMLLGLVGFAWGALICVGASQMQDLSSFTWSMVGCVLAIPAGIGIYGLIMLYNPRVKAGFEEIQGAIDEDEEPDKDDDEDDDEDEDDRGKKKGRRK